MTAPEARPGGLDGNARGLMVLVAALAVGFLLLLNAGGGSSGGSSDNEPTSSGNAPVTTADLAATTTEATTTTAATASDRTPSEIKVVVLNGSGQAGAAGSTSETIGQSGYTMGTAGNAPANIDVTTVYYADGYQAEATDIALLLGKSTDAVQPLSEASLGGAEGDANVVVVLGADTPPVSDSSGSSTTTSTTLPN